MLTGYTTALPPSAALPIDAPFTVDAHLLGVALVAALALAAVMIVVRGAGSAIVRRPVLRIFGARVAATSRRAA